MANNFVKAADEPTVKEPMAFGTVSYKYCHYRAECEKEQTLPFYISIYWDYTNAFINKKKGKSQICRKI